MNGLVGARVVLLDDEPKEALPVIKAFSKVGVAAVFFDGSVSDLPKPKKRLRGVRLAILDVNLGVAGGASNKTIASTLVQTFSNIISPDNGPYGVLIWTNHPDLRQEVVNYIHEHATLPKPVFVVMLKKAAFKRKGGDAANPRFAIGKLSKELIKILAENSPLECMQVWEGACFNAATNVTNAVGDLTHSDAKPSDLTEWSRIWRDEALKLLLVLAKAQAETQLTADNCIPSIFLALNPLHSDRMDILVEELAQDLSGHVGKIMAATGASATERKAKVNSMLHLAPDQLDRFNPGNLYVFGKRNKLESFPALKEVLAGCTQGKDATAAEEKAMLCGLEITPACDYAQGKMGLSRIIAGFVVPWDLEKSIKNAAFLKRIGPFYFDEKRLKAGAYLICFNSRYVLGVELNLVKKLGATARVRAQLLGDVQSWASYQAARQGVMMLG
jgi:hypothetical protein